MKAQEAQRMVAAYIRAEEAAMHAKPSQARALAQAASKAEANAASASFEAQCEMRYYELARERASKALRDPLEQLDFLCFLNDGAKLSVGLILFIVFFLFCVVSVFYFSGYFRSEVFSGSTMRFRTCLCFATMRILLRF